MNSLSHLLFARPSFLVGAAQLIDFGNTLFVYNESASPEQADYFAVKSDWMVVGDDLRRAVDQAPEILATDPEALASRR